jgi:ABC-type nitrate/sulfonate/bicarbonate transport system permease component
VRLALPSWRRWLLWFTSIGLFFLVWQLIGASGRYFFIQPPGIVLPTLWGQIKTGELLAATGGTLRIAATGFLLGSAIGVSVGILMGVSRRWAAVLDPVISGAYATPVTMFLPVIAVYLGLEFKAKVFLVISFNIFVIIINTSAGVREVSRDVLEMGRAFGVSRFGMYRKLILPSASPQIITGLRLAVGRSVQGAILADLFLRAQNLGLFIISAASSFRIDVLLAAIFFVTILAAGIMLLARILEWWLLRWKTT